MIQSYSTLAQGLLVQSNIRSYARGKHIYSLSHFGLNFRESLLEINIRDE